MILALVHNGRYNGWYKIDYNVYSILNGNKIGKVVTLLPTITAVLKVKVK